MSRAGARNFAWLADGLVLLAFAVLLRGPTIGHSVIDWDESDFALVARAILAGDWPYTAVFDHKPIALYLHYAAALALFGDSPIAVRILGIATAAAGAFLARSIATVTLGLSRGWGVLLGCCYLLSTIGFGGQAVFSEHLVNLYLLLALFLLSRPGSRRMLLSGCAAGIAINTNYLAIAVLGGMLAGYLIAALGWRMQLRTVLASAALFGAGAIAATALLLLPVGLSAGYGQYFEPQLRFLWGYAAPVPLPVRLVAAATLVVPLLPLASLAIGLAVLLDRSGIGASDARSDGYPIPLIGALAGSAIAAFASGYLFAHYMLLLVPWMLLLVASLAAPVGQQVRTLCGVVLAGTSLMIAWPGILIAAAGAHNLLIEAANGRVRDEPRRLAAAARPLAPPGSEIYVVCAPIVLYQLLDARPATHYPFYPFALNPRYAAALGLETDRQIAAVVARRATLIIIGDYDKCGDIPETSWKTLTTALRRSGYVVAKRFGAYSFLARNVQAGTAVSR